ncbi:hypothetical protein [Burkholderia sp. SIMBA_062]|uniref:hypothetical protein n=1 Tax=Burkholderia sp. SIMBA_062 TaxID=3085803 RepID=UPI00397DE982
MKMPDVDSSIVRCREAIACDLRAIVGDEWVLDSETERRSCECDGLTASSALPLLRSNKIAQKKRDARNGHRA